MIRVALIAHLLKYVGPEPDALILHQQGQSVYALIVVSRSGTRATVRFR